MFDAPAQALFPLPLTAFEKYMYLDDRPDYPMVFALHIRLAGRPDRAAFRDAFAETLARHPLLCSLVVCSRRKGLLWKLAADRRPEIDWNGIEAPLAHRRGERIDLRDETGLRLWMREDAASAQLTLQFHHAACDGLGAFQFLADLLAAYGRKTAADPRCPTLRVGDPSSLSRRGRHPPRAISGSEVFRRSFWTGLRDLGRLLFRRPAVLSGSGEEANVRVEPIPFLGVYGHPLEACESLRLREAADRQKVTVNALLMREMFICLQSWLNEQSSAASSRWIRIAVPVSLRTGDGDCMSAANQVSYNLLTRDRRHCDESVEFLQSLHRENLPDSRLRRGLMFLRGISCFSRIPGVLPLYLHRRRCLATAVLSNLGDINRNFGALFPATEGKFAAGNLVLESFVAAPPIRPNTPAAFTVHKYDRRYTISLRCDPLLFTASDARRLLSRFVERLKGISI